jgi:hypothetical protein
MVEKYIYFKKILLILKITICLENFIILYFSWLDNKKIKIILLTEMYYHLINFTISNYTINNIYENDVEGFM